ncbi:DUF1648 domain-containing protein [Granulicella paludicola]|uniref:DUF1648 domain-containing protein n=1 Tax=Granulicella paludicola TaxID=474951 RepID=UPI0021E0F7B8|nr:DUF1648 domain-containing protein [Granulicella paludicola]
MKPLREAITLLGLVLPAIYLAITYSSLPSLIPSHFSLSGQPDRFAARGVLWFILGISAVLYLLLTVVGQFPRLFNLPGPRNGSSRARAEALGKELVAWLRLEIVLTFAWLVWSILSIAHHRTHDLSTGFTLVAFLVITATTLYYLFRMKQAAETKP